MHASSRFRTALGDRRRLLTILALLLGLGEFADAFEIDFWQAAAVFSALFLAAALWTRRGGIGGPILVGALCVFELQSFPTWKRTGVEEWVHQTTFAAVSAVTLLVAIAVLRHAFAGRKAAAPVGDGGASA